MILFGFDIAAAALIFGAEMLTQPPWMVNSRVRRLLILPSTTGDGQTRVLITSSWYCLDGRFVSVAAGPRSELCDLRRSLPAAGTGLVALRKFAPREKILRLLCQRRKLTGMHQAAT